ncbi:MULTISPECIES: hypothetical protein [unclassified Streptomyces]|uniref:hypothetical protein n=1 Tax=unclassified Streptomyces TaxID=2593676 RepID=UPI002442D96E|nr:hypothetical protein [Streptomyces sp. DH41]MDG9728108.1 hypothetical protein [Streptomyces sp. DH41]
MEVYTALRLLPWLSAEGKPCFLAPGDGDGIVSRLADETEARQLAEGLDVLRCARRLLHDPVSPNAEVRYTAIRLAECLADVLRVAESRGRRLPVRDGDTDAPETTAQSTQQ